MWTTISDVLADTGLDTLKTVPVLFLAYLLMEYLEHRTSERTTRLIRRSGRWGPALGALIGVVPQCGFSAAASSLYAGRVITASILKILGTKALLGMMAGFIIDAMVRLFRGRKHRPKEDAMDVEHMCKHDHAHQESDGILISALKHTGKITVYLFLVSLALNALIAFIGKARLSAILSDRLIISELLAGVIGLIPNCAASVVITQLYLEGMIGAGPMMSGLLVGAGIGILVLLRENEPLKKNLAIIGMTYGFGVLFGVLIDLLHITF